MSEHVYRGWKKRAASPVDAHVAALAAAKEWIDAEMV
jgi:hypothetical protein